MANVMIDIAAEFVGKNAFKQAETATDKLTKNVKGLAKAFGLGLSATAVLSYGKAAVKAAAADQKAQQQLALALKNVGLGRDAAASEDYIQKLQSEFGIVDDELRPAYQALAIATRDTFESQRLLNLALDISAGTGKDLSSVTAALSRAYLGNNTALSRLGVGISKADLKSKSFYEITEDLTKTFKGSATQAANTYAGQMAKLSVASENVAEIIGVGIIDSLKILSGNTSVEDLATDMETAATNAAAFLKTISEIVRKINAPLMSASGSIADFIEKTAPFVNLIIEGDPSGFMKKKPKPFTTPMTISGQVNTTTTKPDPAAAAAKKRAAELLAMQKKTLKAQKDAVILSKAKGIFDMQKIQIEAALKGKISEEERLRLLLMKAMADENISDIDKYMKLLDAVQKKTLELRDALKGVDPFASFNAGALNAVKNILAINDALKLGQFVPVVPGTGGVMGGSTNAGNYPSSGFPGADIPYAPTGGGGGTTVNVTVQGSVIAENDLAQTINTLLNDSSAAGSPVGYRRQAGLTAV
jgi:hypothetical protein